MKNILTKIINLFVSLYHLIFRQKAELAGNNSPSSPASRHLLTYSYKRSYEPKKRPERKARQFAAHNNRKATRGRGFRLQIIKIRSKKTGQVIEYRAIRHAV